MERAERYNRSVPELPEVEVLRRSLIPRLLGQRIVSVEVANAALREPVDARHLSAAAAGRRVTGLGRRGKYLLIGLENHATLVIHLGMSGRLTLVAGAEPREAHEHVAFHLESGERLRFRDPRRFGLVLALPTETLFDQRPFRDLGPEPLGGGLSGEVLAAAAARRRGPVKGFLMDGRVVVGVGNIYACEALHRAGIHPKRSVARIAKARWDGLARAVVGTLEDAIAEGGTTLNDFADGEGNSGYFQVALAVYDRQGEPCPCCGAAIRRIVQSGRSTFYCGSCQR
jgi:formamidopyrimidine-DNA glycosylase